MATVSKKKTIKTVLTLLAVAAAGYFAWKKWGPKVDAGGNKWTMDSNGAVYRNGKATNVKDGVGGKLWIENGVAMFQFASGKTYRDTGNGNFVSA